MQISKYSFTMNLKLYCSFLSSLRYQYANRQRQIATEELPAMKHSATYATFLVLLYPLVLDMI